jgi:uncharacterized OB-fold protein
MAKNQVNKDPSTVGGDLEEFVRDENGNIYPTIENFYRFCSERKFMGIKCKECGTILIPPRMSCLKCDSSHFDWVNLKGKGKLLTYSIVHIAPTDFQATAPYIVGIVELEEGRKLPGIVKLKEIEDIKIGMDLVVDFEKASTESWVGNTRYYFKQP